MNDQDIATLDTSEQEPDIDIGRPVEWMVDPERHDVVLGVTYEFTETCCRKTVWYTPNKRRAKAYIVVAELPDIGVSPVRM